MKRIVIAAIMVIVAIVLVGSGVWYLQGSHKSYAGEPEPISIGVPKMIDSSALIFIADDQHFFADNGLNVTIKEYDAGLYAVDDMLNGSNDIAVATEFVLVGKVFKGEKVSSIGSIAKYQSHYLIGRKDRGIEKVTDLKGKKVGLAKGTSGEFYLSRYLELHGISLADVTLIDIKPSQYTDAILNGTVDAALVWEPSAGAINDRSGNSVVSWPAQSGQLGYWNAICRDDWAAQHPELVNRFLRAIDQAEDYTIYHPAEAKAIVKKRMHVDDAYIAAMWPNTYFTLSLDQSLITAMEDEGRWMINNNLTGEKTLPDLQDCLYPYSLNEVKPESVNIILKSERP
jgi:NitT/TauT family transport system substrate-binding protein